MDLIKKINETAKTAIKEDAAGGAVGGGAIAMCAMPLFSTLVKRSAPEIRTIKWNTSKRKKSSKKKKTLGIKEAFYQMSEDTSAMNIDMSANAGDTDSSSSFDPSAVISKLKGLENKDRQDRRNTVSFGLEDENGGVVRVSVSTDQAQEFEKALQSFMSDSERDTDAVPEIAEVLFKLKDKFDIVDVQWPDVHEDEEENIQVGGGDQAQGGAQPQGDGSDIQLDGDQAATPDAGAGDVTPPAGDDGQVKDLLTQVIDMMKADAEARKAEARAREAEAKTKEADTIVQQTLSKVKQEEQFLDMEQYNKARKEEEREAKRLAQLAKWKHDMSRDEGIGDDDDLTADRAQSLAATSVVKQGGEEEERSPRLPRPAKVQADKPVRTLRGRVHPHDLASFILSRVK